MKRALPQGVAFSSHPLSGVSLVTKCHTWSGRVIRSSSLLAQGLIAVFAALLAGCSDPSEELIAKDMSSFRPGCSLLRASPWDGTPGSVDMAVTYRCGAGAAEQEDVMTYNMNNGEWKLVRINTQLPRGP
jgi:hypothetical protein